jgi:hypothetical protein
MDSIIDFLSPDPIFVLTYKRASIKLTFSKRKITTDRTTEFPKDSRKLCPALSSGDQFEHIVGLLRIHF